MISRKPFADRNEITPLKRDVSPEKKESNHYLSNGGRFSGDSGFISPETICRPKLSASRRASPLVENQPFTSFRLEDSRDTCNSSENDLPSKAIADLWNKPLKFSGTLSTKTPKSCVEGTSTPNRWNDLPPTKLSFDSCESSADENSPPPANNTSRKGVGFRRSLSYTEPESCIKDPFKLLSSEGTPVFQPKRHKFQNEEISPYKAYLEKDEMQIDLASSKVESTEANPSVASSSLTPEVKRLCFTRSQSESALTPCSIKKALEKIESNPNLIGDGSKSYILPFKINGKHQDLKEITGDTLCELLEGKIKDSVTSFKVIDCRYPYEYDGGHIKGAINLFTRKQVYENLIQPKMLGHRGGFQEQRNILIFHCEFSSQRGPEMCRYLRDSDREANSALYPYLYYPELYVLYGGYKAFFEQSPVLCEPQTYLPMDHPSHVDDCRHFKSRTKLEYPAIYNERSKKSKSQIKFSRTASFAKKCNF